MRTILNTTFIVSLMAIVACSDPPPPPPPPAPAPLAQAPEPAQINAENADVAADALEKEIAADAD